MKNRHWLTIPLFLFMLLLPQHTSYAAGNVSYYNILAVHFTDSEKTVTIHYAREMYEGESYEYFGWNEDENLLALLALNNEEIQVSVEVLDPSYVDVATLKYDTTTNWNKGYLAGGIDFRRPNSEDYEGDIFPTISKPVMEIEKIKILTTKKGFHPSKNNYATIYICNHITNFDELTYHDLFLYTQLRVINSEGKCVFKQKFDVTNAIQYENIDWSTGSADTSNATALLRDICDIHWDGKASAKNEAGLKKDSYVPDGNYTIEATSIVTVDKITLKSESVTTTLRVNRSAPKGYNGQKKSSRIPIYTGDPEVDYLAEKMCKAAGVTLNMSDDKKIKKIYQYMVKKFKHTKTYKKKKKYYNVKKLSSKIKKFKATSDKKYAEGKILYSYLPIVNEQNAMVYRGGVCDDNAAIFMILCNHVGVVSYRCGGYYVNSNGSRFPHAWNLAVVNGKIYYYDVDVEIQNYKKGQKSYHWYKKTYKQHRKNHDIWVSNY